MFKPLILVPGSFLLFLSTGRTQTQQAGSPARRDAQIVLKCDQQKVVYSRFDEAYARRIIWQDVSHSEHPPADVKKEYSPQHTKWSVTIEPDRMKPGPWNTVIYFGSDANEEVWKLSVNDNIQMDFKWLSEKLVFGSAWWGRIYATDMILDLDQHKFVYREMAQYGDLIQPCK
jgi:hypothetical protein